MSDLKRNALDGLIRALADPSRRAILERLSGKETSVKDLTAKFKISQPAVSQHLAILRSAGLLNERHEGRRTFYSLNPKGFIPLMDWFKHYQAFWPNRIEGLKKVLQEMG